MSVSLLHTLPFAHSAGLRCFSPASGMSRRPDGRRTSGVWTRRSASLPLGRAGGSRSRATVNGRDARPTSGTRRWRVRQSGGDIGSSYGSSQNNLRPSSIISRKFMQYTAIICMNSCSTKTLININSCNANALFDMRCGNSDICLTQLSDISGGTMTLIYSRPLQLDCRNATGEGINATA